MTLDDVIQGSGSDGNGSHKGGKKGGKGRQEESFDGDWRREGGKSKSRGRGSGEFSSSRKDTKLDMTLDEMIWADNDGGRGSKGRNRGNGSSWGESTGKGSFWNGKGGTKGRGKADGWGGKGGKGSSPQWMEHDDWRGDAESAWNGNSKTPGVKSDWEDGWRGSRLGGNGWDAGSSPSWRRIEQPPSNGRTPDRSSGMRSFGGDRLAAPKRGRGEDNESYRNVKRIKVTNVPRDLASRDIKDAFEAEAGKTVSCELDRGVAYLTFMRTADARKAVETFDRGELNGKTIAVTLDP